MEKLKNIQLYLFSSIILKVYGFTDNSFNILTYQIIVNEILLLAIFYY